MPISVECDACGYDFTAADKFAGKAVRCPECSETLDVPSAAPPETDRPKRERPTRERPSRPRRERSDKTKKRVASGSANHGILIGGGAVVASLVVLVLVLVLSGGDDAPTDDEKGKQETASSTLEPDPETLAQRQELETPQRSEPVTAETKPNSSEPGPERPVLTEPLTPDPTRNLSADMHRQDPSVRSTSESGDRVAWLFSDGTGFAKKEDMWVYSGDSNVFSLGTPEPVTLALYETMRTPDFVELFSQDLQIRVRLRKKEVQVYRLAERTVTRKSGGLIADSTILAGPWLTPFELPDRDQQTPIEPNRDNLPPLISAVERQVARIDFRNSTTWGNGSGFLADEGGRIVTNYHVIEGCSEATAVFADAGPNGEEVRVKIAGFLYADAERDIAVLQAALPKGFRPRGLPLGTESKQGETVVAFGAPMGLSSTTTVGTVSAHRTSADLKTTLGVEGLAGNWIQTDTSISSGNSGGPLVNLSGKVIAINTMTLSKGQQLNFGISAADIKDALEKSEPLYKPLSPDALPKSPRRVVSILPGGRPPRKGEPTRIPIGDGLQIPLWPIEDKPEGRKHLASLKEVRVRVVGAVTSVRAAMQEAARTAIRKTDVRVVTDEGPILLIVPEVDPVSETTNELRVFAHLYVVENGEALRIWRGSGDIGRVSNRLLAKTLGRSTKKKIATFFESVTEAIQNARKLDTETKEKDKQDSNPFNDRTDAGAKQ